MLFFDFFFFELFVALEELRRGEYESGLGERLEREYCGDRGEIDRFRLGEMDLLGENENDRDLLTGD